ncbi:PAS domain-containing protein [Rhodothermus profundi]|uniref:PAS fold-containing protein n=1 Tax=Rhodothermus profundi TaxID=633813 RepID=A0A1M6P4L3_9BACT|nr:PAS domain-containing protein [Rhodothermus profundi]SHK02871.1 PAS fold-containing protein [Rhodothermus profundi]
MKTPETDRLAAALEALPVGVVICDAEGRVAWANQRARQWLAVPVADLSDCSLPALLAGLSWPPGEAACHVRGATGQLLAVQAWPLASAGFVVQLQPVHAQASDWQPLLLRQLLEGLRRPVANIRAAIETLTAYPDMAPDLAAQFQHIILEQTEALTRLLETTVAAYTRYVQTHWPLECMAVGELLQMMADALAQQMLSVQIEAGHNLLIMVRADRRLWRQLWERLGRQLRQLVRTGASCSLSATTGDGLVWIELQWQGRRLQPERLQRWLTQTLSLDEQGLSLTLAEVLSWHEADLWVQSEADGHRLRLVLPAVRS